MGGIVMSMKAAVLHGAYDIRIEDIPKPMVEPNDILVKVNACGICGSDLHYYKLGDREGMIFGHEFSGDVVEVGANVTGIIEGERVTGAGYRPCGQCYWCKQGQVHRCSAMAMVGYELPGALAEYVLVPRAQLGRTVFRLPEALTYEEGATVEPLSVAVYAVRRAQPQVEGTVVVIGAGIIGLCVTQALKAVGVSKVIVSGRRAKRLKAATEGGADLVINAAKEDPVLAVKEATSGMCADIVVECAGSLTTFQQAIDMVRGGGKIMLVGVYEQPVTWDPGIAINKNVTLVGCLGGNFPRAIDLLETGKVKTRSLITHEFPLDQAKEAFGTQLRAQDAVKVLVRP
jgi:2-desacetyl-2-hydroxyethyl bacteriochlorophyllide A dehydrogenase